MAAFDPATLDRWRALAIVDRDGTTVGTISEFYLDRETGYPTWALVNTGLFGATQSFVPLVHATEISDGLQVPYAKSHIKDTPRVDLHDELTPDEEAALFAHYGVEYQASVEAASGEAGVVGVGETGDAETVEVGSAGASATGSAGTGSAATLEAGPVEAGASEASGPVPAEPRSAEGPGPVRGEPGSVEGPGAVPPEAEERGSVPPEPRAAEGPGPVPTDPGVLEDPQSVPPDPGAVEGPEAVPPEPGAVEGPGPVPEPPAAADPDAPPDPGSVEGPGPVVRQTDRQDGPGGAGSTRLDAGTFEAPDPRPGSGSPAATGGIPDEPGTAGPEDTTLIAPGGLRGASELRDPRDGPDAAKDAHLDPGTDPSRLPAADQDPSRTASVEPGLPGSTAASPGPVPTMVGKNDVGDPAERPADEAGWPPGFDESAPANPPAGASARWREAKLAAERNRIAQAASQHEERSPLERARRRLERLVGVGQDHPDDISPEEREAAERARQARLGVEDDDPRRRR